MAVNRTYGELTLRGDKWVLETTEGHVAIRLKQVFPRIRKSDSASYEFPMDDMHAADLDWFVQRYPMHMSDKDRRRLSSGRKGFENTLADLERILHPEWKPDALSGLREGQHGRTYQAQAVEIVRRTGSLLLGDDVGLGKTYTALLLALAPECLPMAIVVEPHLQKQWEEKLAEFTTLTFHSVKKTKEYKLPNVPIVFFRYSNLFGWTNLFAKGHFKSVVYDEVQNLRTGTSSEKGTSALTLTRNTKYHLGLSATPIFNYGSEIYEILRFLTTNMAQHPLGNEAEFAREWLLDYKRVKDPDALGSFLRERHLFVRRTKGDVGQEMDRVTRIPHEVPYDSRGEEKVEEIAQALALRSFNGSFIERGQAARDLDMMLRQVTGVAKAKAVAHFVQMIAETGEPVLLAGWHREFYRIVEAELRQTGIPTLIPVYYTGTESPAQKEKTKQSFLSGQSKVMLISLRSGSGLDGIQRVCSTAVIGELDWSGAVHDQLIGRLDREGQEKPVTAFIIHTDGGSDPSVVEVLSIKQHQARGIVDPNRVFAVRTLDDSPLRTLAKAFLHRRGIKIPETAEAA